jgi:hypothetical protein
MPLRVLVAVAGAARGRLERILAGHDLTFAATLKEVRAARQAARFDAVLVGTHFEESTTFEALREVLGGERPPPVICVRALPFGHGLGKPTMHAFRAACHELGVSLVLDLVKYREDAAGDRELRRLLERTVNPARRLSLRRL